MTTRLFAVLLSLAATAVAADPVVRTTLTELAGDQAALAKLVGKTVEVEGLIKTVARLNDDGKIVVHYFLQAAGPALFKKELLAITPDDGVLHRAGPGQTAILRGVFGEVGGTLMLKSAVLIKATGAAPLNGPVAELVGEWKRGEKELKTRYAGKWLFITGKIAAYDGRKVTFQKAGGPAVVFDFPLLQREEKDVWPIGKELCILGQFHAGAEDGVIEFRECLAVDPAPPPALPTPPPSPAPPKEQVHVTAKELVRQFLADFDRADADYKFKSLHVEGVIRSVRIDKSDAGELAFVHLEGDDSVSLELVFDIAGRSLKEGQTITVIGSEFRMGEGDKSLFMLNSELAKPAQAGKSPPETPAPAPPAERRTWTSIDGKFSVEAEFLEVVGVNVKLKTAAGKEISVPLSKLSLADRLFALELKKQAK